MNESFASHWASFEASKGLRERHFLSHRKTLSMHECTSSCIQYQPLHKSSKLQFTGGLRSLGYTSTLVLECLLFNYTSISLRPSPPKCGYRAPVTIAEPMGSSEIIEFLETHQAHVLLSGAVGDVSLHNNPSDIYVLSPQELEIPPVLSSIINNVLLCTIISGARLVLYSLIWSKTSTLNPLSGCLTVVNGGFICCLPVLVCFLVCVCLIVSGTFQIYSPLTNPDTFGSHRKSTSQEGGEDFSFGTRWGWRMK